MQNYKEISNQANNLKKISNLALIKKVVKPFVSFSPIFV